jgi:hypothetical protein
MFIFIQKIHYPYSPSLLFIYSPPPANPLLLPVSILCLSQSSAPPLLSLPLSPYPVLFSSFHCFYTNMAYFIIHTLSVPPPLDYSNSPTFGSMFCICFYFILFWCNWSLNLGLHTCKADALLLEPYFQSILLWLFWRWGLVNYLPMASNHDLPDLSLPSS